MCVHCVSTVCPLCVHCVSTVCPLLVDYVKSYLRRLHEPMVQIQIARLARYAMKPTKCACGIKLATAATVADGGPGDVGRSGCGGGGDGGASGGCPRHPAEKPCQAVLVR